MPYTRPTYYRVTSRGGSLRTDNPYVLTKEKRTKYQAGKVWVYHGKKPAIVGELVTTTGEFSNGFNRDPIIKLVIYHPKHTVPWPCDPNYLRPYKGKLKPDWEV